MNSILRRGALLRWSIVCVSAAGACLPRASADEPADARLSDGARTSRVAGVDPRDEAFAPLDGDGAPTLGLDELVAYALEHAPRVAVAERRRAYADAERRVARLRVRTDPSLELAFGPRFGGTGSRDFDFIIGVEQPIEIAGERGRRLAAADRYGERLADESRAATSALATDLARAYGDALVARLSLERLREVESLARTFRGLVAQRFEHGDASEIDVQLAEVDLGHASAARLRAEATYVAARLELARLVGWADGTPPHVAARLEGPRDVPPLDVLLAGVTEAHPRLAAQRGLVRELEARLEAAEREAWPDPSIGVQVAREGSAGSPANYIVLGTLGMQLPLVQRNRAERERLAVELDVARAELAAAESEIRARLATAHAELSAARASLSIATERILPGLDRALELVQRGFEAGELSLIDVLVLRDRLLAAAEEGLRDRAAYLRALADLAAASAGVWSPSEFGPSTEVMP